MLPNIAVIMVFCRVAEIMGKLKRFGGWGVFVFVYIISGYTCHNTVVATILFNFCAATMRLYFYFYNAANRIRFIALILIVIICGQFFGVAPLYAQGKVALLIGNAEYKYPITKLRNPINDIKLIKKSLEQIGFKNIIDLRNASKQAIIKGVEQYTSLLKKNRNKAVGLIYYSGHGLADKNGVNFLIPSDASLSGKADLWQQSIQLEWIVSNIQKTSGSSTHFVIFDACRNSLQTPQEGTKSLSISKGFHPIPENKGYTAMKETPNILISFATAEGQTAQDGIGNIGPYAKELARHLLIPGLESVSMFRKIQLEVQKAINQKPLLKYGSLRSFYFKERTEKELALEMQLQLMKIGCYSGKPDGVFGSASNEALKQLFKKKILQNSPPYISRENLNILTTLNGTICSPLARLSAEKVTSEPKVIRNKPKPSQGPILTSKPVSTKSKCIQRGQRWCKNPENSSAIGYMACLRQVKLGCAE